MKIRKREGLWREREREREREGRNKKNEKRHGRMRENYLLCVTSDQLN